MAIGSVLAGIAMPNLVSLSAQYQLTSAAHQVAFDVGRARMCAVGENVFTRVRFANGVSGSVYWIERSEDGMAFAIDGPIARLPEQVAFAPVPQSIPRFNRQGLGIGTSVINLANAKAETKTVSVNVLGRVTVE